MAFCPDSRLLASSRKDRTIKLWDLSNRTEMITLQGHQSRVVSIAYSADGNTLALASADHTVKLWRAASKQDVRAAGW